MTLKNTLRCALLVATLAATAPALAFNWLFMQDTPYSHFTEEDHKIFDEVMNDLLEKGADGDTRAWSNPNSTAGGDLKVVNSFERNGVPCRTLSIANKAKGRTASGEYRFCKQAADKWAPGK